MCGDEPNIKVHIWALLANLEQHNKMQDKPATVPLSPQEPLHVPAIRSWLVTASDIVWPEEKNVTLNKVRKVF